MLNPKQTTYLLALLICSLILVGCSNADAPTNLEPKLEILEASDITRTSAVISTMIDNRGSSSITYLKFCYGEGGKFDQSTENLNFSGSIAYFELNNLKPGTTYNYYAEGGTSTATIQSETLSFTTYPNERPKVSEVHTLSSGPTGVVVEFEIEDDGGEDIVQAGCCVQELTDGKIKKINLPSNNLSEGKHQLYITGLKLQTAYKIFSFASNSFGETISAPIDFTTQNGIVLLEAGILQSLLGEYPVASKSLTISGDMNGDDFRFLRQLVGAPMLSGQEAMQSAVEELDLADVNIVEGGASYDGSRFTETATLTEYIFANCKQLKNIIIPNTTIAIRRDAFAECQLLETFNVPLNVKELQTSSGCLNLEAINVSETNPFFSSSDGVVFNKDASKIYWFPIGKTGHFELPPTITSIGERAFIGTHITSLTIPSSVSVIERGAFLGSALENISLPDNLTNISEGMFQNCSSLRIVTLGSCSEFIGNYVFDGTKLTDLYVLATIPPFVSSDAFFNRYYPIVENCTLHVPTGCKAIYRNHSKWKLFKSIIEN
ncbi:MAG: leucine-rich repeat protein [Muribaculaceae bacterium]|nr:leucine-rich repeat protein [Muribaculaceae bacterium]